MLMTNRKVIPLIAAIGFINMGIAFSPVLACDFKDHQGQVHQITSSFHISVDLHSVAQHHYQMTSKHNEIQGFSGTHLLMVDVSDRNTGEAVNNVSITAKVYDPDQKLLGDEQGVSLGVFRPQGKNSYYGVGYNMLKKGTYKLELTLKQDNNTQNAIFNLTVH